MSGSLRADGLQKSFRLGTQRTLFRRLTGMGTSRRLTAVRDVSLRVGPGEVLGIVGDNGSGKSTLLRLLAGIYVPDRGSVTSLGRVIPILQLGAGMQQRLTMRENIRLVSTLFGMTGEERHRSFDAIVDFAELHAFVDEPLFRFSQGMQQRLAFSIAAHSRPDVLLLDEVFEVGDGAFRHRSAERMRELLRGQAAVVMAGHREDILREVSHSLLWMEEGRIVRQGDPSDILAAYAARTADRAHTAPIGDQIGG